MPADLGYATSEAARAVRASARPLASIEDEAFAAQFDQFADARVVLLGEASHGTSEFYRARAAVTQRLIERHGFNIVAVEGDWPDVAELDRFARNRGTWGQHDSFMRFPRWMWRNAEVSAFVRRLRTWNLAQPADERTELRGLDVYSLTESLHHVLAYLDRVDPKAAVFARRRYGCLTPYLDDPQQYGARATFGGDSCEDEVVEQLVVLLSHRLDYMRADGEDFLDAEQNARVVQSAESYYRAMYQGAAASWNLRDSHMFDTLKRVLAARGPHAKAVVWAHNSHIGNAAATAMGDGGEFNIGQLCRESFDDQAVLIGFGTDRGEVMAADDWGGPALVKSVLPSRPGSWEHLFANAAPERSITAWRNDPALGRALQERRLERAIGVIYRPQTELRSHYFHADLARQFDAFVWFGRTSAVTPLAGVAPEGGPDTFPFGL